MFILVYDKPVSKYSIMAYFRLKRIQYSIIVKAQPQNPHRVHSPEPFTDFTLMETTLMELSNFFPWEIEAHFENSVNARHITFYNMHHTPDL